MDIEKYIMEYSNMVPKDLTDEIMGCKSRLSEIHIRK
jgi:hypothetical protein